MPCFEILILIVDVSVRLSICLCVCGLQKDDISMQKETFWFLYWKTHTIYIKNALYTRERSHRCQTWQPFQLHNERVNQIRNSMIETLQAEESISTYFVWNVLHSVQMCVLVSEGPTFWNETFTIVSLPFKFTWSKIVVLF